MCLTPPTQTPRDATELLTLLSKKKKSKETKLGRPVLCGRLIGNVDLPRDTSAPAGGEGAAPAGGESVVTS